MCFDNSLRTKKIPCAGIGWRISRILRHSPKYFQEYSGEGQIVRADIHDARYVYRHKNGDYVEDTNTNAYRMLCFYSLRLNQDLELITKPDRLLEEFGEFYSIVNISGLLDAMKFFIETHSLSIDYVADWVRYLLPNYRGAYSPFAKSDEYGFQNEFRIVLLSNIFLSLGEKEPYKTIPYMSNMKEIFLEPKPLEKLFQAKKLTEL